MTENQHKPLVEQEEGEFPGDSGLQSSSGRQLYQPVFLGSGSEFFRIWVVNMLFSLLTLGIWSAWATVRNRRYLYGNVEFAGNRLDFHGKPMAILRGRILAVLFFFAYALGGDFYVVIPSIAILLLITLYPWILVSAMRFRLSNTSWRNLRFDFSATPKIAYSRLGLPVFLILVAYGLFFLYLSGYIKDQSDPHLMLQALFGVLFILLAPFVLVPLAIHRARDLVTRHTCYGRHKFNIDIRLVRFIGFYGRSMLVGLAAIVVYFAVIFLFGTLFDGMGNLAGAAVTGSFNGGLIVLYAVLVLAYLLPFSVWKVSTTNYVISATRFENLQFKMEMKVWSYWWIMVTNAFMAVISLGLAIPWTRIRMIRYKLSCLSVQGELAVYQGSNVGSQAATGDEIGDAFDIDFGF